ncbi:HpcH/HpaI aldolase/citrate lyase family protein [Dinoroseobacter sp. PD6]|uniref:HpcH/HpaI aldolase family protein n=1 Tax=Dinoroseobacter sp. PD6 TaxID=3028384 RepID=UPI00237BC0FF|nr:HpcH/HpaI aldolase/citrate lyase family protein [Dinoroseobacter sp. PD6]MDD9715516.1 HpcH/HpaI aldolase/citrate lyase family protein [Dinoroseobacter sp. PD6]
MAAPENQLKQALLAGDVQIGIWLGFGAPAVAELAAGCGFDWCLVDGEHSPNDPAQMIDQLRAMVGQGAMPIVRVPVGEDWVLKRALDLGVQTIMVPMVETAAQAQQIVRAMRYPPDGVRGVGAALARASGYSLDAEYVTTANAQICTIVQIESHAAVRAIPEIAAVEGVDVLFIGPADLAADMGYPGRADAPEVDAVICAALGEIARSGKVPGVLAFSETDAARFAAAGARFLGVGADVTSLSAALRGLSASSRARLGAP